MEETLMNIREELLSRVNEIHHHDSHYNQEEGYHIHEEGEIFEDEMIQAIQDVFNKYQ